MFNLYSLCGLLSNMVSNITVLKLLKSAKCEVNGAPSWREKGL